MYSPEAIFELELPQVRASVDSGGGAAPRPRLPLLVLGGRAPEPGWLQKVAEGREIWALDSGADVCLKAGLRPFCLLGDLDSISDEARDWAEELGVAIDRYSPDKDDTDFQLALKLLSGDVLVTGCWGGRFDHAFSTIFSSLLGMERGVRVLCFADEREILFPLQGPARLTLDFASPPSALSLLPLTPSCEGVSIKNVKWPLEDAVLLQAHPQAISNVPLKSAVTVSVCRGVLGVYAERF